MNIIGLLATISSGYCHFSSIGLLILVKNYPGGYIRLIYSPLPKNYCFIYMQARQQGADGVCI